MGSITDIRGIRVGHAQDTDSITGCTVILFDRPRRGAVDLRGGGTGTRQIDSLLPHNTLGEINGVLITGGSAYGLDASGGVMRYLEEKGTGLSVGNGLVVPSVPTAVIFDLGIGDGRVRPDANMGYQACVNASAEAPDEGSVGVGTGATIGKLRGLKHATKGGLATSSCKLESGVVVGVLVVVNAFGDVISPESGKILAGVRNSAEGGQFEGTVNLMKKGVKRKPDQFHNTTIAVVATNGSFTKSELSRIAGIAQTGISRVISPVHTVVDGDMVIAVSAGDKEEEANLVGVVASGLLTDSVLRAVQISKSMGGIPSALDMKQENPM